MWLIHFPIQQKNEHSSVKQLYANKKKVWHIYNMGYYSAIKKDLMFIYYLSLCLPHGYSGFFFFFIENSWGQ